jgi:hypothetical protein
LQRADEDTISTWFAEEALLRNQRAFTSMCNILHRLTQFPFTLSLTYEFKVPPAATLPMSVPTSAIDCKKDNADSRLKRTSIFALNHEDQQRKFQEHVQSEHGNRVSTWPLRLRESAEMDRKKEKKERPLISEEDLLVNEGEAGPTENLMVIVGGMSQDSGSKSTSQGPRARRGNVLFGSRDS